MALPYIFNFRSTSTYVTDSAGETYCISATNTAGGIGEAYAVNLRDGISFGWEQNSVETRDRNSGLDRRFAGTHFNGANTNTFRVDLPATGTYSIRIASGDPSNAQATNKFEVLDDLTSKFSVTQGTSAADRFIDATGAEYSSAAWPGSNTAVQATFATTKFILKIGNNAAVTTGFIVHLEIAAVSAATPTKPMWPMSYF